MSENPAAHGQTVTVETQTAGTLRVISGERSMKTFVITESELRNVSLANGVAGLCFSFMSALWGYSFSLNTDLMFEEHPSVVALQWVNSFRPICSYGGLIFAALGVAMLVWRHMMISLIKRETA